MMENGQRRLCLCNIARANESEYSSRKYTKINTLSGLYSNRKIWSKRLSCTRTQTHTYGANEHGQTRIYIYKNVEAHGTE